MTLATLLLLLVASAAADETTLAWRTLNVTEGCHFRQTGACSGATGARQPAGDLGCSSTVPCHSGTCPSGYCDCGDGLRTHPVDCKPSSHSAFRCADVCATV